MLPSLSAPAKLDHISHSPYAASPKLPEKQKPADPHYLITKHNQHLFDPITIEWYNLALTSSHAQTICIIPIPKEGELNLSDCHLLAQAQIDCFGYGIRNSVGLAFFNNSSKKWVTSIEAASQKALVFDQRLLASKIDLREKDQYKSGDNSPTGPSELTSPLETACRKRWASLPGRAKF